MNAESVIAKQAIKLLDGEEEIERLRDELLDYKAKFGKMMDVHAKVCNCLGIDTSTKPESLPLIIKERIDE